MTDDRAVAFIRKTVGLEWRAGAQGPDAFDCWSLVCAAQFAIFGRDLPVAPIAAHEVDSARTVIRAIHASPLHAEWHPVDAPEHGDIVTMAHHRHADHVGIYLACDRGGVLHCARDAGVCFDPLPMLKLKGFLRVAFYRFGPGGPDAGAPAAVGEAA